MLGLAARAAGEDRGAVARGTEARGVKAGRGEDADRVGLPRMAGQARSLGVGEEHRALLGDGVARTCDAHDGDRAALSVGEQAQRRAETRGIAGDDLIGSRRRASSGQAIGRQRGALPAVGDGGVATEPYRRGHVGDRGADAGDGGQALRERRGDPGTLTEGHAFFADADDLVAGHDGARRCVAFDRRVVLQRGLECHAAGHRRARRRRTA